MKKKPSIHLELRHSEVMPVLQAIAHVLDFDGGAGFTNDEKVRLRWVHQRLLGEFIETNDAIEEEANSPKPKTVYAGEDV